MSDDQYNEQNENWFEQETDDGSEPQKANVPKQLREAFKREKAEKEALRQEFEEYKQSQRDKEIKQLVTSKGLPEKVIGLIGDRDPEEFLTEYGELFGASTEPPVKEETPPVEPVVTADERKQLQEMANVQPVQSGVGDAGKELESQLDEIYSADISEAERHAQLRAMGAMI